MADIIKDAKATITLTQAEAEPFLRSGIDALDPDLVNYPQIVSIRLYREPPGNPTWLLEVILND